MPQIKKKKVQDDSDSSDTSLNNSDDDRKAQAAKKAKTDSKASKSSSSGDSDDFIDIGKNKRVTVREFKGKLYVDIREFYMDKNSGDMRPGKKGVSLTVEAWRKLCDEMPQIEEAIKAKA